MIITKSDFGYINPKLINMYNIYLDSAKNFIDRVVNVIRYPYVKLMLDITATDLL